MWGVSASAGLAPDVGSLTRDETELTLVSSTSTGIGLNGHKLEVPAKSFASS